VLVRNTMLAVGVSCFISCSSYDGHLRDCAPVGQLTGIAMTEYGSIIITDRGRFSVHGFPTTRLGESVEVCVGDWSERVFVLESGNYLSRPQ